MAIAWDPTCFTTTLVWTGSVFASGNGATVLGWRTNENPVNTEAAAMAENMSTSWDQFISPNQDNQISLAEVRWETLTDSGSASGGGQANSDLAGIPSNGALLVSYYATGKGPRSRGRSFWPGLLGEAAVNERGEILQSNVTGYQTMFDDFFADLETDLPGTVQAIPQSTTEGQKTPPILPWPIVNQRVVRNVIGTQRRRVRP